MSIKRRHEGDDRRHEESSEQHEARDKAIPQYLMIRRLEAVASGGGGKSDGGGVSWVFSD